MTSKAMVMLSIPVPREALTMIAAPPDTLSQMNVEQATGVPARTFLEMIRRPGFPVRVTKLGRLRVVDRLAFVGHVRGLGETVRDAEARAEGTEPDGESELLEELGLEQRKKR